MYTWGEHTEEYTRGERTRRSTHGESTLGGIHTENIYGGSKYGESTHWESNMEEYEVSLISSSIELQWAKFSNGIFYST